MMKRILIFLSPIIFLALIGNGCKPSTNSVENAGGVMVSIGPQEYFVRQLLPERIPVHLLVPAGASPHAFEPGPADMVKLENSRAFLRIGHIGFELALMDKISSLSKNLPVFDVSEGVALLQGHHHEEGEHNHHEETIEGTDPHIWMSPSRARIIAKNTRDALITVFPEIADSIEMRHVLLQERLIALDSVVRQILHATENRTFAIFHPSLSYFADDYGLVQLAIEEDGKDPSPAHVREVVDQIKAAGLKTILVQREFNRDQANAIAQGSDIRVVIIDPLSPDWYEGILQTAKAIGMPETLAVDE